MAIYLTKWKFWIQFTLYSWVPFLFEAQSRLGGSVAVVDVNLDGADDLAIGAPAFVMTFSGNAGPLDYQVILHTITKQASSSYVCTYHNVKQ